MDGGRNGGVCVEAFGSPAPRLLVPALCAARTVCMGRIASQMMRVAGQRLVRKSLTVVVRIIFSKARVLGGGAHRDAEDERKEEEEESSHFVPRKTRRRARLL